MKNIIRIVLHIFLSLYFAQWVIGSFRYSDDTTPILGIVALFMLYFFLKPLITVISLPTKGSTYFLILFISTSLVFYALSNVLDDLFFSEVTLMSLTIFGIVLPSRDLTPIMAMIFSAFVTSASYLFLESLCKKRWIFYLLVKHYKLYYRFF